MLVLPSVCRVELPYVAGVVRCGVRTGEAEGVTVTDGIGGEVGMSAAVPRPPTTLTPPPPLPPRGESRLPMVILLGDTIVILLELFPAAKRLVATPVAEVKLIAGLAGEEEVVVVVMEREEGDC